MLSAPVISPFDSSVDFLKLQRMPSKLDAKPVRLMLAVNNVRGNETSKKAGLNVDRTPIKFYDVRTRPAALTPISV